MKLVFFNRYYWPDSSATSQLLTDLATYLAANGRQVVVVTGNRRTDGTKLTLRERERGVEIHRLRASALGHRSLAGRAIDFFAFYAGALWWASRNLRCGDVVVAKTDPPLLGAALIPAVRLKGAALVNWLQDLYPEIAEELGVVKSSTFASLLRRLRDASLRAARVNVVIGDRMRERVAAITGAGRAQLIHNWSGDLAHTVAPSANNPYRRGHGSAVLFCYSGNLGRAHRFEALLTAGAQLRERRDLHFLVIGDGPQLPRVQHAGAGFANWSFLPPQPRERLADALGAADVHVVSLDPRLEGLVVPSKVYGVLAAARPCIFIGASDGEIAELLRRHDCGVAVSPEDPAALVTAIERLAGDVALRARLGANARRASDEHFAATKALERWAALLGPPPRPA